MTFRHPFFWLTLYVFVVYIFVIIHKLVGCRTHHINLSILLDGGNILLANYVSGCVVALENVLRATMILLTVVAKVRA